MSRGKIRASRIDLKAARVRLGLDQEQLAKASGLSREAIIEFEWAKTVPHESTWNAIPTALETRGIVFTNGDRSGFYFDKEKAAIPT